MLLLLPLLLCLSPPAAANSTSGDALISQDADGNLRITSGFNRTIFLNNVSVTDTLSTLTAQVSTLRAQVSTLQSQLSARPTRIFVTGGKINSVTSTLVEAFDGERWSTVPSLNNRRRGHAMVTFLNMLWVSGGDDGSTVERFDGRRWVVTPPALTSTRAWHTMTVYNGSLFLVGGYPYGSTTSVKTVERWSNTSWIPQPNLISQRGDHAAVEYRSALFVFGGSNDATVYSSVERFNGTWSTSVPMRIERMCFSAVVFNNFVYIAGGITSASKYIPSVHRFDGTTWDVVSTSDLLPPARELVSLFVFNGTLFAVGGSDERDSCTTETYNEFLDGVTWSKAAPSPFPRCDAAYGLY